MWLIWWSLVEEQVVLVMVAVVVLEVIEKEDVIPLHLTLLHLELLQGIQ
jgi:hypothetical protein